MPITFNIRDKNKRGLSSLYYDINYKGIRIRKNTGYLIKAHEWDKERQKVNLYHDDFSVINKYLDNLYELVSKAEREFNLLLYSPSESEFLSKISLKTKKTAEPVSFYKSFDAFVSLKSEVIEKDSLKAYNSLRASLLKFDKNIQVFSNEVFNKYVHYMKKKEYNPNTIIKQTGFLKAYCKFAKIQLDDPKINLKRQKFDSVPILEPQLELIWNVACTPIEEEIKKQFIFMAYTAMRLTDMKKFNPKVNLKLIDEELYIYYIQNKTNIKCMIPVNIHPYLGEILKSKWIVYSDKELNKNIKIIAKKAGLTEEIQLNRYFGEKSKIISGPLYKFITAHTGRRTFVTNMYYRGLTSNQVSKMSGHSDAEVLAIYNKTESEKNAIQLNKLFKNN